MLDLSRLCIVRDDVRKRPSGGLRARHCALDISIGVELLPPQIVAFRRPCRGLQGVEKRRSCDADRPSRAFGDHSSNASIRGGDRERIGRLTAALPGPVNVLARRGGLSIGELARSAFGGSASRRAHSSSRATNYVPSVDWPKPPVPMLFCRACREKLDASQRAESHRSPLLTVLGLSSAGGPINPCGDILHGRPTRSSCCAVAAAITTMGPS